jgi:hypothetical protein
VALTRKEDVECAILKEVQVQGRAVVKYYATSLIRYSVIVRFSVYELSISLALVFLFPFLCTLWHYLPCTSLFLFLFTTDTNLQSQLENTTFLGAGHVYISTYYVSFKKANKDVFQSLESHS